MLLLTSFYGGLVVLTQLPPLMIATLVAGFGGALVGPSLSAAYLDITPEAHRSTVMGLKGSASALGGVAGPLLVAVASVFLAPQAIFGVSAALGGARRGGGDARPARPFRAHQRRGARHRSAWRPGSSIKLALSVEGSIFALSLPHVAME